jgi:MoaA/NifB/PqqE/SkfB family radical SAM enzyme
MKLRNKIKIGSRIVNKMIFSKKAPLLINWALTNRCNFRCQYCDIWKSEYNELNTSQVFFIINELCRCGNAAIAFSGGEPLLREDLGEIIDYCKSKGIYTKITTNGSLVTNYMERLKNVDLVRISLDGPRQIQDIHRQQESYHAIVEAVKALRKENRHVLINCVITKLNLNHIPAILLQAQQLGARIYFQPLEYRNNEGFICKNMPSEREFKGLIAFLISEKKKGNNCIGNSSATLHYLLNWPALVTKCWAGELIWRISPDGKIFACDRFRNAENALDCLVGDLSKRLKELPPINCKTGCLRTNSIELNFLLSLNLSAILNIKGDL